MMVMIVNMFLVICIYGVVDGGKCFDGNCANDGDYGKFSHGIMVMIVIMITMLLVVYIDGVVW